MARKYNSNVAGLDEKQLAKKKQREVRKHVTFSILWQSMPDIYGVTFVKHHNNTIFSLSLSLSLSRTGEVVDGEINQEEHACGRGQEGR